LLGEKSGGTDYFGGGCGGSRREIAGMCDGSLATFRSIRKDITLAGKLLTQIRRRFYVTTLSGFLRSFRSPNLVSRSCDPAKGD